MQTEFQVGAIASVHGIKGEVKVFPTTDEPEKFKKLKKVVLKTEKEEREMHLKSKARRKRRNIGEQRCGLRGSRPCRLKRMNTIRRI